MNRPRGAVLLEVMIAVAILAFTATASLELVSELAVSAQRARTAANSIADQDRLMTAYSLLTRADLSDRIGARRLGRWTVSVQRQGAALYHVAIGDGVEAEVITVLYRPVIGSAER